MPVKSSATRYGKVAASLHWLTAILILGQFVTGFQASDMTQSAAKADLLWFHAPLGNAVLFLTVLRIVWWWFFDKKPAELETTPKWQAVSAKIVHLAFYVLIFVLAASGVAMIAMSGADEVIFDGHATPLPDFFDYPSRVPHGLAARLMGALLLLHIGAALYHQFILKDGLLSRMRLR